MRAVILFPGTNPILAITNCTSLSDPKFINQAKSRGIKKFIAYEVPIELVKERYGEHFNVVITDPKQTDDFRTMDIDVHRIFRNFFHNLKFKELGPPLKYELE